MANFKMQEAGDGLGVDPSDASGAFLPWVGNWGGSSTNFGQITTASAVAATQIIAANPSRLRVTIANKFNGGVWLSNTSASTTASSTGFLLAGNASQTLNTQGAIFGLASSGTAQNISFIEEAL